MNIPGSLCVISGASSGIGKASALELARRGARVVLVARRAQTLEQLEGQIRASGGQAWAFPADLSQPREALRLGEWVLQELGTPDILIHSAGAGEWRFLDETPLEDLQRLMDTPYFAAAYLTRVFLPAMLQQNRGFILSVCSPASRLVWPGATGYIAARWALNGFTEALRADLYYTKLQVCAFFPGKISDSEYFTRNTDTERRIPRIGRLIPEITSQQAALGIVRALEQDARMMFVPWQLHAFDLLARWFPRIAEHLAWRTGARRRDV
ncbi:SDR family NAD(P)-dependent oxidoreductase [Meiothermus sp. CFH 77666]|uniref:SDR family NAD(P)-dependent oxidoreductase n=1 Tax=Meiothermus sp. CFH 77666 TaxID=2817942 RepID=UPI001AA09CE4|nr:SDR family NAD(P)-dependent oxidoreductase [Meiothermus sp. CFH 77666]MBO1438369.1 SDR family NAD(P)-dependent oxidoreductase [Meiothermus sp. CFH 77666]